MQLFSESVSKLWNEWELRVMVLISLSLQIILNVFGNRRKYITKTWVNNVLWLTYLSADWVATVALGVLCNMQGNAESIDGAPHKDSAIMAFWAPFLLVHLGGPDTITAYSLEDNELWKRHFLGLLVQVGVALYVFLRTWASSVYHLNLLAIPVFIAGIIKYGERTWVLRSASTEYLKYSLLPTPDPLRPTEYLKYSLLPTLDPGPEYISKTIDKDITPEAKTKNKAYFLFKIYRRLYADLPIDLRDSQKGAHFLLSVEDVYFFKVIELELGFLYDELYTKTSFVCSVVGICLRSISSISSILAFVGFLIIDKHGYSSVNVIISYVLLVGAIILDIYAAIVLLFSDWTMVWLTDLNRRSQLPNRYRRSRLPNRIFKDIFSSQLAITGSKRWSHSMRQYNLIDNCLRHDQSTKCLSFFRKLKIYENLENCQQIDSDDVLNYVQKCFRAHYVGKFDSLRTRTSTSSASVREKVKFNKIWTDRGEYTLEKFGASGKLGWSIEGDFDESIILWHIATDLYYHHDTKNTSIEDPDKIPVTCRISRWLSDYMLYLLVMRPFMLPKGIGQIRYKDTAAETKRIFQHSGLISGRAEAIKKLLRVQDGHEQVYRRTQSFTEKFPTSRSVLQEGCKLARDLLLLNMEEGEWKDKNKWDMIFLIWMDLLCYAASRCRWNQHAQQLARGGELLTHVSLFMAHLGLTDLVKETSFDREQVQWNRDEALLIKPKRLNRWPLLLKRLQKSKKNLARFGKSS